MKIITNNAIYVQKNDIFYLAKTNLILKTPIYLNMFGKNIVIDNNNKYEFVKFDTKKEISFFKNIDWIIDYNAIEDLSIEEIRTLYKNIDKKKNSIAYKFNSMSLENKKQNINMMSYCEELELKLYSLKDILYFRQGYINMTLPTNKNQKKCLIKK